MDPDEASPLPHWQNDAFNWNLVRKHKYALSATEITYRQFEAFRPDFERTKWGRVDAAATRVSWEEAARYCSAAWALATAGPHG